MSGRRIGERGRHPAGHPRSELQVCMGCGGAGFCKKGCRRKAEAPTCITRSPDQHHDRVDRRCTACGLAICASCFRPDSNTCAACHQPAPRLGHA
jgi:hypothetical protein